MKRLFKDIFQRFVVCFNCNGSSINVIMEFIASKYDSKQLFLNLRILFLAIG